MGGGVNWSSPVTDWVRVFDQWILKVNRIVYSWCF